jgi:hypothetical protein
VIEPQVIDAVEGTLLDQHQHHPYFYRSHTIGQAVHPHRQ